MCKQPLNQDNNAPADTKYGLKVAYLNYFEQICALVMRTITECNESDDHDLNVIATRWNVFFTVNSKIFSRILFLQTLLKEYLWCKIFATWAFN